jgi:DNA-directed RNA polymerase specialized sigma24 family protein
MQEVLAAPAWLAGADASTIGELYRHYAQAILAYLHRCLGRREDAEDLALEVFLAAVERDTLASLSEGEQYAWLCGVARHKLADYHRWAPRRHAVALDAVGELLPARAEDAPEQAALRAEAYACLRANMQRLPACQQAVVYWRFVDG